MFYCFFSCMFELSRLNMSGGTLSSAVKMQNTLSTVFAYFYFCLFNTLDVCSNFFVVNNKK